MALSNKIKNYSITVAEGDEYDNLEMLKNSLWEMTKPESNVREKLLRYKDCREIFLANPILMAIIIEDYELVEALLDKGYKPSYGMMNNQGKVQIEFCIADSVPLNRLQRMNILQWILVDISIPDEVLVKVLDSLYLDNYVIKFSRDVVENTNILYPGKKKFEFYDDGFVVALNMFSRIARLDARYVNGGMEEFRDITNPVEYNNKELFNTLFEVYKEYEDVELVIKCLISGNYNLDIVAEFLPKLKEIVDKDDRFKPRVVIDLFALYRLNNFDDLGIILDEKPLKKIKKWLKIIKGNTDMWNELMVHIQGNIETLSLINSWVKTWKELFGEKFIWDKSQTKYLAFLAKVSRSEDLFQTDKEDDILRLISFMGYIDEVKPSKHKSKRMMRCEEEIVDNFLMYENEELCLLALKMKLFDEENIEMLIDKAMDKRLRNLVPLFIYAKSHMEA